MSQPKGDAMKNAVEWALAILILLAAIALIFVVTTAHAENMIDSKTVGDYLTMNDGLQTGIVLGTLGTLGRMGMVCKNPGTVGVMRAWLATGAAPSYENVYEAIARLSVEKHGCFIPDKRPNT